MRSNRTILVIVLGLTLGENTASADVKSLCSKEEATVWSCQIRKKIYSVCASKNLAETTGYLQYRAGVLGKVDFIYPRGLEHPKDYFTFGMLARGTWLAFSNGSYRYWIAEEVTGKPVIEVSKDDRVLSAIECDDSTYSLTLTSTMDMFRTIGVFK